MGAPILLRYRTSTTFIAFTVGLGVLVDLAAYGLIVPVIPFRLQSLGYDNVPSKVGWLVAAYAAGLIVSSPPIAYIGGRIKDRRTPLLVALLFMAGALVLFMETASFEALLISRILQGFSGTGIWSLGLALITDSVPEERVGSVMGFVMIGFSVGSLIGAPVGGILYQRLGYRAPFVFALCLVAVDFALRLIMIEKRVALKWIAMGVEIPGFEAPGYTPPLSENNTETSDEIIKRSPSDSSNSVLSTPSPLSEVEPKSGAEEGEEQAAKKSTDDPTDVKTDANGDPVKPPSKWAPLIFLLTSPRPVTLFGLTVLNGFILGGMLETGMTLWLQYNYDLNALGAGLVFIGAAAPAFFISPLAGWLSDKYGAKWVTTAGIILSIPSYCLLLIRGPLPLFVFFLVLIGTSLSLFITPVMQDLSVCAAKTPGLGTVWVYAAFNMCFSIGAFIGPIVAGQIIDAVGIPRGWVIQGALSSAFAAVLVLPVVLFVGGRLEWRRKNVDKEKGREMDLEEAGRGAKEVKEN